MVAVTAAGVAVLAGERAWSGTSDAGEGAEAARRGAGGQATIDAEVVRRWVLGAAGRAVTRHHLPATRPPIRIHLVHHIHPASTENAS